MGKGTGGAISASDESTADGVGVDVGSNVASDSGVGVWTGTAVGCSGSGDAVSGSLGGMTGSNIGSMRVSLSSSEGDGGGS